MGPSDLNSIRDSGISLDCREAAGNNAESIRDPPITPGDGQAVADVQNAIQKWGYYQLTILRGEADLVVFLRKGRTAGAYVGGHAGTGIQFPGGPSSTHKPEFGVVAGADVGSNVDKFWVYSMNPQRQLIPVWQKDLKDGLDKPKMILLFQQRRNHCRCPPGKEANPNAEVKP